MTAQRHIVPDEETSTADRLLDATYAAVMDVGLRRTTVADVARRAGVSRMTVYRQGADLDTLVGALLKRELVAVLDQAQQEVALLPTSRQRLSRPACSRSSESAGTRSTGGCSTSTLSCSYP